MVMNMPNWLKQRAFLTPDRSALVFNEQKWTFSQLFDETRRTADRLYSAGIKKGDYCGILAANRPETVFTIYALQQIGATAVMLNSRLTTDEIAWQLHDAKAVYLLYDQEHTEKAQLISRVRSFCITGIEGVAPAETRQTFSLDETCSIMYTSGTTGRPKGVIQTYGNHYMSATASALNLGLHSDDTWLCAVPLFHISGYSILMKSVLYGMEVHLMEKFEPERVNQLLKSGNVTMMSVVTAMLSAMLHELEGDYSSRLRCMLLGGGPAPVPILEACKAKGIPVFQTYGMTETASQIVTLTPEDSLRKLGSAGKPLFPCAVKIDRADEGEILVSGPNVTPGYLNRPEANKQAFQHGWFRTGDIGRLDEDGFLYVLDRRSDLIISGGENIYPAEIESVLTGHPAILEAGVTGVPNDQWGSVPAAFYVNKEPISEEELIDFCREKLARYKVPAYFVKVDTLPKNAANKLLRRELAKQWSGQDED
ncbi:o-succinylbenzoate--CoA ligase [Domibacillus sp. A3M-37]|uniref:o-succinylbenzoate--CoA ligase n=1 Tax=Domibacillus sp. A3M-37 TaxID=2962037 RepID=UPI0020B74AF1|nr:o-succinylbenzoate--CoA ligase [Domibacillus sp. A3M-37]MCP3762414.1 o-succinylbenzoate--CoA ligase [Domibacillus sp. A3M-37]